MTKAPYRDPTPAEWDGYDRRMVASDELDRADYAAIGIALVAEAIAVTFAIGAAIVLCALSVGVL